MKVYQPPPLPLLWRAHVDSSALSQDVDMLHRQVLSNVMAFPHSGGEHARCILDF